MTLTAALAHSINTDAVRLSLEEAYGGRKQVLANLQKMGIEGLQQTCSLALGDQGITVLNHTVVTCILPMAANLRSLTPSWN